MPSKELPFMICASIKEMEYPHVSEKNVIYPGPILIPVPPLSSEQYPELVKFLDRKRTIDLSSGIRLRTWRTSLGRSYVHSMSCQRR